MIAGARCAALGLAALAFAGCGSDGGGPTAEPSGLESALAAVRDCRVASVVSLHSGVLYLELEDGERVELSLDDQRTVYAALERAQPRCGDVSVATE